MQVSTSKFRSRVLMDWLATREDGLARAGLERAQVNALLPENSTISNLNADELAKMLGASNMSMAGRAVTPETAMKVSTVYACVSLIAGAISTLPLEVYERDTAHDSRKKAVGHDYWWMLNEQANDSWSSVTAFDYFVGSKLFYGDSFGVIQRPTAFTNRATGWTPVHSRAVEPFYNSQNGLRYRVIHRDGTSQVYDPADILHVPSLGFDGLRSPSPITYAAREVIGASLAAEEYNSRFFSQGSTHDIALKSPKKLDAEQMKTLRESYLARHAGGSNARMPLILSGGLEVETLSITPADAELILSRRFSVEEICRALGVPPFMVGATDKSTSWGSGIEQQGIGFVKYTLRRHLTPIEQEFNRKLWPNREKYFVEYYTAALERGDFKTRMEGYRIALGRAGERPWMKVDEIRRTENLPPVGPDDPEMQAVGQPAADTGGTNEKSTAATAAGQPSE
jgi:HK97 family phage portal protein